MLLDKWTLYWFGFQEDRRKRCTHVNICVYITQCDRGRFGIDTGFIHYKKKRNGFEPLKCFFSAGYTSSLLLYTISYVFICHTEEQTKIDRFSNNVISASTDSYEFHHSYDLYSLCPSVSSFRLIGLLSTVCV